jgi:Domain of unknown function (DUF4386)
LNYMLFKSKLVPRFISIWGLIGAVWLLAGALLFLFGSIDEASSTFVFLPLAVQEMVFAVWLIVKGFNLSAIRFSENQDMRVNKTP